MKLYTIDDMNSIGNNVCGIYLIQNNLTHEAYIGQSVDILKRWQQHEYSNARTALYEDIKKYGLINFSFGVLDTCSPRELDEAEVFWIKKLDTYDHGYNNTKGNLTVVQRLKENYELTYSPSSTDVETLRNDLSLEEDRNPYLDYDYIHGTDKPSVIDGLILLIENGAK